MATPPKQPRLGWAKSAAQNLLRNEEIFSPAVPIEELLEQYADINTFYIPDRSPFCCEQASIWQAYINMTQPPGELHYEEAKLLGHLLLHHLEYDEKTLTDAQLGMLNCEAGCFADCVTMPAPWVLDACPHGRINQADAERLAGLFSVSHAAMVHRLHELRLYAPEDFCDSYK